ncbi:MAG: hypothetical protein ACRCZB_04805, partial [Bacteroidales bacterium]
NLHPLPMKKLILLITAIYISNIIAQAQIKTANTLNLEVAFGANDMPSFTPMVGASMVLSPWFSTGIRYSKISHLTKELDKVTINEHNIELMANFSPLSIKDILYFNGNVGMVGKTQNVSGIPVISFEPKPFNFGLVGEAEIEVVLKQYFSVFGRGGFRFLFIDKYNRLEGVYVGGLRINTALFKAL